MGKFVGWREAPARPYKPRDPEVTAKTMSAVKSRDSRAEMTLRRALWRRGLRYRLHARDLPGKPDIVFRSAKIAIFVDGDFWHGKGLLEDGERAFRSALRTARQDWWVEKIAANVARDKLTTERLKEKGWLVVRVWESDVTSDVGRFASKMERAVAARTSGKRMPTS